MKLKKTIAIDPELYKWVNQKIEEKEFSSLSHAVEKALYLLKNKKET
jgi:Arc/MetJ-type ribon-helix-helix transcriptional regulator